MWKEVLTVFITATGSLVILFLLCRLMGNKQISQMSMFDYIIGISIGSIAAELATELESPLRPALAMTLYALIAFLISVLTGRFPGFRKLMTGGQILLMENGTIYRENMRKARLDLQDFLTLCRVNGYFDIADIEMAVLEENGTVSFLPKETARPLEPRDVAVYPPQTGISVNVVLDGTPLLRTLQALGRDEEWLCSELRSLGYHTYDEVYLATLNREGKLSACPMTQQEQPFSPFD